MDVIQMGCISALCLHLLKNKEKRRCRRYWVHPTLSNRLTTGHFHVKFMEHRKYPEKFFSFYRMSVASFDVLLTLICAKIQKTDTNMRSSIQPAERLIITLRYLATGSTFASLEYVFQVGQSTIRCIVREVCIAIWEVLQPIEMPHPKKENWLQIADTFYSKSNFPNCVGAIDGKHIRIVCPSHTGSSYYNYKNYFSMVLLAVADANYCFTAIDVGSYGREGDSNIFKSSILGKNLANNTLDLPEDKCLPNTNTPSMPFVFVGDEAFGLGQHLLRPYARRNLGIDERVFNYRLTRARRYVECTFGILANKWRVFHTAILVEEDFVEDIIKAGCILHNFVRRRDGYEFNDTTLSNMNDIPTIGTGGPSAGTTIRDLFKYYFVHEGEIPFQYEKI